MPEPYVYANLSNEEVLAHLTTLGACDDAVEWVRSHGGDADSLLAECPNLYWLIWYAGRTVGDREFRLFACDCAERVLHLYEARYPGDTRPRDAIEMARRFANGDVKVTHEELASAAYAAAAVAADAAAYAAAYAAYAAYSAAAAAAYAAAADAADAAAYVAARDEERAWQRDRLVRYIRGEVPDA